MLWPHLTFYTHEAMQRLEDETLARCFEALRGQPLQRGLAAIRVCARRRAACASSTAAENQPGRVHYLLFAVWWLLTICNPPPSMPQTICPMKS